MQKISSAKTLTNRQRPSHPAIIVSTIHLPPLLDISIRQTFESNSDIELQARNIGSPRPVPGRVYVTIFSLDVIGPEAVTPAGRQGGSKTLALSSWFGPEHIIECARSGVTSLLHISITPGDLIREVFRVAQGGRTWPTGHRIDPGHRVSIPELKLLTQREKHIFSFMLQRFSNAEIASELCLANQTVKNYVSSILRKLGSSSRTELVQQFLARPPIGVLNTETSRHLADANWSQAAHAVTQDWSTPSPDFRAEAAVE